jgi:hypothetical protein
MLNIKFGAMLKLLLLAQTTSVVQAYGGGYGNGSKPLISSLDLEALIKPENLLARAEELFAIAQTSEPELGHPTRVIGSAG